MPRQRKLPTPVASLGNLTASSLNEREQALVLGLAAQRLGVATAFPTFEDLLISPEGFALGWDEKTRLSSATPLQRAICRLVEGQPLADLDSNADVAEALGFSTLELREFCMGQTDRRFREVVIIAAIRSAKSMISAAHAVWSSQHVDVSGLGQGEIPRYTLLSLSKDNAKVTSGHLTAALQKPALSRLRIGGDELEASWKELIEESGADFQHSEFLRHPTGRPMEIRVIALKRAGGSAISRWSFGQTLDEAPRMVGASEGVMNYDDGRRAVLGRLLPGAQLLSLGSPWRPSGPVFDMVQNEWGQPKGRRLVIKARGPQMNPKHWTPQRCEELKNEDAVAYQTDVLAEFADLGDTMFPAAVLTPATREAPDVIPYEPGHEYVAAIDPATRGNAWTLMVADRVARPGGAGGGGGIRAVKRVVLATQWVGSTLDPLKPREVIADMKAILAKYHLSWFYTDQWAADFVKDLAQLVGLSAVEEQWDASTKANAFLGLEAAFAEGSVEIPNDAMVHKDLRLVRKKANRLGVAIHLPQTDDGRHCDYAPAMAQLLHHWIDADSATAVASTPATRLAAELKEWEEADFKKVREGRGDSFTIEDGAADPFEVDARILDETGRTRLRPQMDGWRDNPPNLW